MAGAIDKLSVVQSFLKALSWQKIAQLTVFFFLVGLAWATYENRQLIYNFASQPRLSRHTPTIATLSKTTTDEIDVIVKKSVLIVGIQVILVDFQRNTRHALYSSIDNVELKATYEAYAQGSFGEMSLFNNDLLNNRRLVDLINGDFVCTPFADTAGAKILPAATKYINTTCSVGIPPFYGKFTGIVHVYTSRQPTPEEVDQIRTMSKNLSSNIFDRDLR
jgi:hypothetical protein